MSQDKIEKIYIPHLLGQFKQATPVLLTGAGFSLGARNIDGGSLPNYDDLCREIWAISFPGEDYEPGSSLKDLFEDARIRHPKDLEHRISRLLSVDPSSLPDVYELIFSLPWFRSYTLNIDNLDVAVSNKFDLPRRLNPISATSPTTVNVPQNNSNTLQNIHLNGTIKDLPNDVTFSELQYAERISTPDPFYMRFITDLISRPVVFIGTSLDEPSLWQHLALRKSKGDRGQRELRPRSYLVTPTLPRPRRALLAEFNIVWLPMTGEEFSETILSKILMESKSGFNALESAIGTARTRIIDLPLLSDLVTEPTLETDFLMGQEPIWSDIQSGRAIERHSDKQLHETITATYSKKGYKGVVVISGTAGSGKSTALMRAALRLFAEGKKIAWVDRDVEISPREIINGMKTNDAPDVLAIDSADQYGSALSPLLRDIALQENSPLILCEVRSGKMSTAIYKPQLEGVPITDVSMTHLTDVDIESLLDVLDAANRLGILKGRPRNEQITAFEKQAGRQLLVAMYQATSGERFEVKVVEELQELDSESKFVYGLMSIASAHRFSLTKDEIIIATGNISNSTLNVIERLVSNHLLVPSRNKVELRTRHRVVAKIIMDEFQQAGTAKDILYGLILAGSTKYVQGMSRASKAYRLTKTFLNHDLLLRMLDAEQARNLYGTVEKFLSWNSHFWLQRGSLEAKEGDLALAENFLSQARSLSPDNQYIDNEWAYFLFKKAITTPGSASAPGYVDDAMKILTELISSNHGQDEYPYHVLGSQGLMWSRKGIRSEDERGKFLRRLIGIVSSGAKLIPQAVKLDDLEQFLRRELLSLSIPQHLRESEPEELITKQEIED